MKKIITIIIASVFASIAINAQIKYKAPSEKMHETFQFGTGFVIRNLKDNVGLIALATNDFAAEVEMKDSFSMFLCSSNRYDKKTVGIYLGHGKNTAITSLKNILKMMDDTEDGGYFVIEGAGTPMSTFSKEANGVFTTTKSYAAGIYTLKKDGVESIIKWIENTE